MGYMNELEKKPHLFDKIVSPIQAIGNNFFLLIYMSTPCIKFFVSWCHVNNVHPKTLW